MHPEVVARADPQGQQAERSGHRHVDLPSGRLMAAAAGRARCRLPGASHDDLHDAASGPSPDARAGSCAAASRSSTSVFPDASSMRVAGQGFAENAAGQMAGTVSCGQDARPINTSGATCVVFSGGARRKTGAARMTAAAGLRAGQVS